MDQIFKNALKGHQTLFIIDDCSAEGEINKKRDTLSELAFSGGHSLYPKTLESRLNGFAYSLQKTGIALRTV